MINSQKTVHVMSKKEQNTYFGLLVLVVITNLFFWGWYFNPNEVGNVVLFVLRTIPALYIGTFLPSMYLLFLGQMRKPLPMQARNGLKVAMITLTVPGSESIDIVKKQLVAMQAVRYPHDSWILVDRVHSPEIKALAEQLGVKYFCRHDTKTWSLETTRRWNQLIPPFKTKTKAGNVNAWIDAYGGNYKYFVQLDVDHIPSPEYLDKTLGYFEDPYIAWVQAPSVYGNFEYWTARGSSEQELVLQGPLQMGFFGFSRTPFIIGSHCTYRMSAIREIGGFQPTRAEDHLDTLHLAAHGYNGVFLPEVIAVGEGPEDESTYLGQQFAWAYSMFQVLIGHSPKLLKRLDWRQKIQFLFAQTWYPSWTTSMMVMFLLPLLALVTNTTITYQGFWEFGLHYLPLWSGVLAVWLWSRRWFQPKGVFLSWRGVILEIARWPVVLSAVLQAILKIEKPYMITTKGIREGGGSSFSLQPFIPYFTLSVLALGACWIYLSRYGHSDSQGYLLFAMQGALIILAFFVATILFDIKAALKQKLSMLWIKSRRVPLMVLSVFMSVIFLTLGSVSTQIAEAVSYDWVGTNPITKLPIDRVAEGIYDPSYTFNDISLDISQNYVDWRLADRLRSVIMGIRWQHRVPFITLEPWASSSGSNSNVLGDTLEGVNDNIIRQVAKTIKKQSPQVILLRWGHEMDQIGLYPWSTENYALFIKAYQHVVDIFNQEGVTNVRWVWSPIGNPYGLKYYPGENYVDYVGLTQLKYLSWEVRYGGANRSFQEMFADKYRMVEGLNKPIIIAELGVAADEPYQTLWLKDAFGNLKLFPLVKVVIYFNSLNSPNAWGGETPDWRIKTSQLPLIR